MSQKVLIKSLCLSFLIIGIGLLLIPRLWSGDVYDNLVGGCLISHGAIIYRDFFSHHAPLPYYIVGLVDTVSGTCGYLLPQFFFYAFFLTSILLLLKYTKSFLSTTFLLIAYAALGINYGTTFVLAESWLASISILIFLLLFFFKSMNKVLFWLLFIIIQFSLLTAMPLYMLVPVVLLIFFSIQDKKNTIFYLLTSFLPFIIFVVYLGITTYYHALFLVNTTSYDSSFIQQYLMYIPSIIMNLFHIINHPTDWQVMDTFSFLFSIAILGIWVYTQLAYHKKIYKKNNFLFLINFLVFINLTFHPGGGHMVPVIFFTLTEFLFFFSQDFFSKKYYFVLIILFLLVLRLLRYEFVLFTTADYSEPDYTKFILTHSQPNDKIVILPGGNELYILTNRLPGSYYYFMLPWISDLKGTKEKVLYDIKSKKVKIILLDNTNSYLVKNNSLVQFMSFLKQNLQKDKNYKEVSNKNGVQIYLRVT